MAFFVYVLESVSTGRRYVGQTEDLERRLAEHNDPQHNAFKFTSRHQVRWAPVHTERSETRWEAMQRQRWLKSGVGRSWLARHVPGASPPRGD